jgi:formylglycine-generating enzyme required for sulfatase activity
MIDHPPDDPEQERGHASIAWPQKLLRDKEGRVVGFIMPKVSADRQLVVAISSKQRREWAPDFLWDSLVLVARNTATAFEQIHAKGYVIGDIKAENILVDGEARVTLVDNDSFQVVESSGVVHYCPVCTQGFLAPELFGCDLKATVRTASHDAFGLGVLMYKLLMCGAHPFVGLWQGDGEEPTTSDDECVQMGWYVHRRSSPMAPRPTVPPLEALPAEVQTLFFRCFDQGRSDPSARPSAREWRQALEVLLGVLTKCEAYPTRHWHYRNVVCPWCALLQQGLDYFDAGRLPPQPAQAHVSTPEPTQEVAGSQGVVPKVTWRWWGRKKTQKAAGPPGMVLGQNLVVPDLGMEMVYIGPGSFQMGSKSGSDNEKPVHTVCISRALWMAKCQVTQAQYQALMLSNPSHFRGATLPVEQVSWNDAAEFCRRLTDRQRQTGRLPAGYVYRLPTEAEWEYAARGGSKGRGFKYAGSNRLDEVAWHSLNSGGKTHAVAQNRPNELGLYDMSGNVWEWCHDWYGADFYAKGRSFDPTGPSSSSFRVLRGGSWDCLPGNCRVAVRGGSEPEQPLYRRGFRVVVAWPLG